MAHNYFREKAPHLPTTKPLAEIMKRTAIIWILLTLLIIGCKNQHVNKSNESTPTDDGGYKEIDLQIIKGKDFIDGCGCYFSMDSSNFYNSEYNLVFDYNSKCVINLSGTDIELISNDSIITVYPDENKRFFHNEKYEILINIYSDEQSGDETFIYKGFMNILIKESGDRYEKEIYGECGC